MDRIPRVSSDHVSQVRTLYSQSSSSLSVPDTREPSCDEGTQDDEEAEEDVGEEEDDWGRERR